MCVRVCVRVAGDWVYVYMRAYVYACTGVYSCEFMGWVTCCSISDPFGEI